VDHLDLGQIHQIWTDWREARVKDGFIFRASRYFIDHWLCQLGTKAAWAVVDLQQRCYLAKSESCQVSLQDLCDVTGVGSTTTMQSIVDAPLMRWFFAKRTTRQHRGGKVVRGKNRYDLQMSDPLTPEHQGKLARWLAERLGDGAAFPVRSPDDLGRLVSDLPPLATLPDDNLPAWATREPLNLRQIMLRVLSRAGVSEMPASLANESTLRQTLTDVQASITRPTQIALATHYFRTEWVHQLGATNAWLVMILRSRCYWNKESGQVRDTCVMSTRELADLLGVSTRTVIRSLQDPLVQRFVTSQERVYERRASDNRKIPTRSRFHVLLTMDPLAPPDEATFAELLRSEAIRYGLDPVTGQMDMLDILDMMSQMTRDEISLQREAWGDKSGIRASDVGDSGDKTGIGELPTGGADLASGDKNRIRRQFPRPFGGPQTSQEAQNEAILPSPSDQEGFPEEEPGDKIAIRASLDDKNEIRAGESGDKIGTATAQSSDRIEKQYSNTFESTLDRIEMEQQQQYTAVAAFPDTKSIIRQILSQYGIEEPALSEIAANFQVTPDLVRAWILYAENEPGLKRKAGYIVQRLAKTPPDVPSDPELLLAACISEPDLIGFAQRWALETRLGASVSFDDDQREAQYRAWIRFYGGKEGARQDDESGDQATVERDGGRALRWQPDIG